MSPEEGTSAVRLLKKESMLKQVWNEAPIRTPRFKSVIRERKSLDFILLGLFNLVEIRGSAFGCFLNCRIFSVVGVMTHCISLSGYIMC